jgi:hypothetical protein
LLDQSSIEMKGNLLRSQSRQRHDFDADRDHPRPNSGRAYIICSWRAVAWADPEAPASDFRRISLQLHGPTQEHRHYFFGSFMGLHKSTGNISWPVAWAHTVEPASFCWERHGPTQSNGQNFLGSCLGRHGSASTVF